MSSLHSCVNAGRSGSEMRLAGILFARILAGRDLSGVVLAQRTTKGTPQLQRMTSFRRK